MIMSKYEEIKLAILALDGVRNVIFGYSDKTRYNCLHFSKDDRSFISLIHPIITIIYITIG